MKRFVCFLLVTVMALALTGVTALAESDDRLTGTWVLDEYALYAGLAMQYGMNINEARDCFGEYRMTYVFTADGRYIKDMYAAGVSVHEEGTCSADGFVLVMNSYNSYSGYPETSYVSYRFDGDRLILDETTPLIRSNR